MSWDLLYSGGSLRIEAEHSANTEGVQTAAGHKQGGLHGVKCVT